MFFPEGKSIAENLHLVAGMVFPLISVGGAIVAILAIQAQRELNARRAYFDYVKLAFDYPHFAFPKSARTVWDHEAKTIDGSRECYEKYEWFVSLMVVCVEGIFEVSSQSSTWRKSAVLQLTYHEAYFEKNKAKQWLELKPKVAKFLKNGRNAGVSNA